MGSFSGRRERLTKTIEDLKKKGWELRTETGMSIEDTLVKDGLADLIVRKECKLEL